MYSQRYGESQRLPYVSEYTPEQMLFLSFAYVRQNKKSSSSIFKNKFVLILKEWCGLLRPQALIQTIQFDVHSPVKYRVNVPLSNFKKFSDVFKCEKNSRMNPKDKCVLW